MNPLVPLVAGVALSIAAIRYLSGRRARSIKLSRH